MSDKIYFITVEDADIIINCLLNKGLVEAWKKLDNTEKIRYLTQSGLILNNLEFRGTRKVDVNQPFEFPRFLSGTTITKTPIFMNYQDYEVAQAIRACKLVIEEENGEIEPYRGNNIASEKSGSTSISYFEPSEYSDFYMAEKNGLDTQSYKILSDWLEGGY